MRPFSNQPAFRFSLFKQLTLTAAMCAALAPSLAQAPIDLRVALVIGNGAYAGNAALANPNNDAKAMSETLRALGFTVVESRDASKAQMDAAIAKVRDTLKGKQAVGMLYYAGHGLQLDWRNYMVPIDAKIAKAADVSSQTVEVTQVIDAFKVAGNRMNIVVLDACRDNPFAGTATGKGLAQLDAPPGTFLAYATAPGNVAEDGAGSNGLYTSYLLQELKKPQAKIEDVFKRVRLNVRQQSAGRQIPWESTSLEDDFYFNSGTQTTKPQSLSDREVAFNQEKGDWDKIKDSKTVADFYTFLQKYPNGNINGLAQSKVEQLQKAKTTTVIDKQGRRTVSVFDVYKAGDEYEFQLKDGITGMIRGKGKIVTMPRGDDLLEGIPSNPAVVGGALLTRAGFLLKDGGGTYDPPFNLYPNGDMQIGSKGTTRTLYTRNNGSEVWVDIESKVVGYEMIDTAFGRVDALKLLVNRKFQDGNTQKWTFWFDPEWGYSLRLIQEFKGPNGSNEVRVRDMISRKRAG